ncbi:MAG: NUDIX hydrolase [Candidatus Moranbacteria bacterium]|nr:NUDIX hydrolase [Candidatus Moranbacteria bacterium]
MELSNNERCPECGRFNNRGTSIDAMIVNDDKILLIKRGANPFKGFWALPGGYVEWDESAEEAVGREVKEELGVIVESSNLIGVYSSPNRHPKQVIDMAYVVTISGSPKAGDDALEFEWYFFNDLPAELAFDHKKIIEDYLEKFKN